MKPILMIMMLLGMAGEVTAQNAGLPRTPDSSSTAGGNKAGASAAAGPGQQIANAGAPNGVTACQSCHGAQGEGNAQANFPRIAGQSQHYLARQMSAFANGARDNPVMTPIAKAMSDQQVAQVAHYYAALDAPWSKPSAANPAMLARGRVLATVGDDSRQVQSCANCHGPGGSGEPPDYPYLAGQHASYLTAAMAEWKNGNRKTDPSGHMPRIAGQLSDSDVAALSAYFAAQAAPAPLGLRVSIPAGTAQRPVTTAVPRDTPAPASQSAGVGTEQGAPTTGGNQGPGGGGGASGSQSGGPQ